MTVTAYHETTVVGVPLFVKCQKVNTDQGFLLGCRTANNGYLSNVGCGYLQEDGIVWISWLIDDLTMKTGETLTFELWPIGADRIGVTKVSLLADRMFSWAGDDPKNPPEE